MGLAQQWDQLDQLNMRMQKNLEHQINAKNMTGVSEDTLREFNIMFKWVMLKQLIVFDLIFFLIILV